MSARWHRRWRALARRLVTVTCASSRAPLLRARADTAAAWGGQARRTPPPACDAA